MGMNRIGEVDDRASEGQAAAAYGVVNDWLLRCM